MLSWKFGINGSTYFRLFYSFWKRMHRSILFLLSFSSSILSIEHSIRWIHDPYGPIQRFSIERGLDASNPFSKMHCHHLGILWIRMIPICKYPHHSDALDHLIAVYHVSRSLHELYPYKRLPIINMVSPTMALLHWISPRWWRFEKLRRKRIIFLI